jgi:hypothetical protein|nr:MAG TPA: peptidyl-tRNA hydrolase [Caudoviricetes sp.]
MIRDSWPGKAQGFYQVNYRLTTIGLNRGKLEKAIEKAKELGMIEGVIRTELTPESPQGTLTCVGFRPMEVKGRYNIRRSWVI